MALRGEGDPRWVVREREDGRNVNGWHWEDKDVTAWAQNRIKQLINRSVCSCGYGDSVVGVQCIDTVEGDATLYNRKGVLKVLYDLKVVGKWSTDADDEGERAHGDFKFELFDDDPEIITTFDAKAKMDSGAKQQFVRKVVPVIKERCAIFIKEMHEGAGQEVDGLRKPSKKKDNDSKVTDYLRTGMNQKPKARTESELTSVVMTDVFRCSAMDMYLALTDVRRLEAITRCRAVSEATVGGRQTLMNGVVSATFVRLDAAKQVVMEWKLDSWGDEAKGGVATIDMDEEDGKTRVRICVDGVPKKMASKTEGFWRVQILQAIKVVLGWGSASKFL